MPHTLTLVSFTTDVYDKVLLSPFYSRRHLSTLANIKTVTDPGFKLINVSAWFALFISHCLSSTLSRSSGADLKPGDWYAVWDAYIPFWSVLVPYLVLAPDSSFILIGTWGGSSEGSSSWTTVTQVEAWMSFNSQWTKHSPGCCRHFGTEPADS